MRIAATILVVALALLQDSKVSSFEINTHRALSDRAVVGSTLNDFLISQLGLSGGINETLSDGTVTRTVTQWIQEGSDREDAGFRFFNHFHNPLRTWDRAGLRILGAQLGFSSVLWGQRTSQGFAWQNARDNYFKGLTTTTKEDRDKLLAAVFQTVGQLIHLPQDAAVPAHTRSDQHFFFEGFERSVENLRAGNADQVALFNQLTQNPIGFDPSILKLPQNPLAPIPIARIIDTTDPEQAAALPSAGTNQGLAEYSNANFLSGDTIFKNFTFPRLESIDLNFPLTLNDRQYFTKIADGETNFFLVAEGTFTERLLSLASGDKGFVLDPRVYQDYASFLLPRAVGYSAGLTDYFFRGRVELIVQQPSQSLGNPVTELRVKVRNVTLEEETGSGEVMAVVSFKTGGQQSFAVSSPLTVNLTRDFQEVVFDFSQNPISSDASSPFLIVVYKGPLGLEEQAVIAGGKPFSLAPPLVCLGPRFCSRIWEVPAAGATLMIEGTGTNNDGILFAQGSDINGECVVEDCTIIFPVALTAPASLSFTAPTAGPAVSSFFTLDLSVQAGGFACLSSVTSTPANLILVHSSGFTSANCPQ